MGHRWSGAHPLIRGPLPHSQLLVGPWLYVAHRGVVPLHACVDRSPAHKIPVVEVNIQIDVSGDHEGPKQLVHIHQIAAGVMGHSQICFQSHVF